MDGLYNKLTAYQDEGYYPFHMPGHKRNTELLKMGNPYALDITEIEGFDNLHQARGILKQLSQRISTMYGAGKSFPLVNGSTVGILAGISAAARGGDKILMARNCHKSVYHAVAVNRLRPVYLYPTYRKEEGVSGGITLQAVEEALEREKDIALVVITSPTFDGMVSDIRAIAQAVHRQGALLMIDEAHGAHLGFHESFPESAVKQGADLVIQSLHKTLPAFTQTAVLHSNKAGLNSKIEYYLSVYESSSPSYVLLAGMDLCINMLEDRGRELFDLYDQRLKEFYNRTKDLKHIKVIDPWLLNKQSGGFIMDPSKIIISVRHTKLSGHRLHTLLYERYHLVFEMEAPDYVLGMTSICDTKEGFDRLLTALYQIDDEFGEEGREGRQPVMAISPKQAMLPGEATQQPTKQVGLEESSGRLSAALVCMYPPGSPLLVPGEQLNEELIGQIRWLMQEGYTITGLAQESPVKIEVIDL